MNAETMLNGNKFAKELHVFVNGKGTYYPTKEIALKNGLHPNFVGLWIDTIEFDGNTWYQAGNTNVYL